MANEILELVEVEVEVVEVEVDVGDVDEEDEVKGVSVDEEVVA